VENKTVEMVVKHLLLADNRKTEGSRGGPVPQCPIAGNADVHFFICSLIRSFIYLFFDLLIVSIIAYTQFVILVGNDVLLEFQVCQMKRSID